MKCPSCGEKADNDIDGWFCTYCPWEEYDESDYTDDYGYYDDDYGYEENLDE